MGSPLLTATEDPSIYIYSLFPYNRWNLALRSIANIVRHPYFTTCICLWFIFRLKTLRTYMNCISNYNGRIHAPEKLELAIDDGTVYVTSCIRLWFYLHCCRHISSTLASKRCFATFAGVGGGCDPPWCFQTKRRRASRKRPADCARRVLAFGGIIFGPRSIFDPVMAGQMSNFRKILWFFSFTSPYLQNYWS